MRRHPGRRGCARARAQSAIETLLTPLLTSFLPCLQECYAWAADGQCTVNPGHMLSQCKYSCWEWFKYRREKYKDAPIDKYMDCNSWASQGECGKSALPPAGASNRLTAQPPRATPPRLRVPRRLVSQMLSS